jgi:GT2 family glycosyltransferase
MPLQKTLSLLIPCYNNLSFLKECLGSLQEQTFQNFEVVVMDNESSDGLLEWSAHWQGSFSLRVKRSEHNLGYAEGVNQALDGSVGEIAVVLNADLTFDPRFLEEVAIAFQNPEIQLVAVHVKNKNGTATESLGIYLSSWLRAHPSKTGKNILGPAGAAFAFRKSLLSRIALPPNKLFDPEYFFLWEDVELALRVTRLGVPTTVLPNALCYHHGNATQSSYFYKQALSLKNRRRLIHRYFPNYCWSHPWVILLYDFPRFLFFKLFNPYSRN